jgi:hypothetical protein
MTIATIKKEIKDLKNALNTNLDEKFKVKLREQLSKSEKTLAEMESAKTPTAKKTATKKANVVAKKSTSVLQKIKQANKKSEPKKSTPAKKSTAKEPSALQKIKNQVKLNKNLSGYKKSGIDLLRDGNRPALPAGKRISKDGNTYYEYRLNHVDVRQPSKKVAKPNKLEEGGMVKNFNVMRNVGKSKYVINSYDGVKKHKDGSPFYDIDTFKNLKDFMQYKKKLKSEGYKEMADGGMMAQGGRLNVVKKYNTISDYLKDAKRGDLVLIGRDENDLEWIGDSHLNRFVKIDEEGEGIFQIFGRKGLVSFPSNKNVIVVDRKYEDGGMMAKGGRLKSALMRDRAYKSNEPYEQSYKRKTRPKNPKYNYGFFADGGEVIMTDVYAKKDGKVVKVNERPMELKEAERFVKEQGIEKYYTDIDFKFINKDFGYAEGGMSEMHRAYAMGGVLQHGLESGDFIVSHDEGKMVVMNGGSKYEVNIHSGSRTKID